MSTGRSFGFGFIRPGPVPLSFDEAETAALVGAMTSPPTQARVDLIDACISALITGGVWTKLDGLHVYAAHDAQAGRLNWKNPAAYNAVVSGTPTFTVDRGYTKGASTGGLTIAFNPTTAGGQWQTAAAHLANWSLTSGNQTAGNYEIYEGAGGNTRTENLTGGFAQPRINSRAATTSAAGVGGDGHNLITIRGTGASDVVYFRNKTQIITANGATATQLNNTLIVLGNSNTRQIAVTHFGGSLTGGNVTTLYDALLAYLQGVGAA